MQTITAIAFSSLVMSASVILAQPANLGLFSRNKDVGSPSRAGSVVCDPAAGTYLVSGGGSNMWAGTDDFQFVYKEMSGDLSFSASVRWPKPGGNAHRKACLLIRQSLDPDSPYVDVAQHGVGLTALQFRETKGGNTQETQSSFSGPARIGIEKRGDYVSFWISNHGEELHPAGGSFKLPLTEPFYVGLAVSAHDNNTIEQAEFSKVELKALPPLAAGARGQVQSTLEFMPIASTDRTIVYHTNVNIQAPNWTRDNHLIFNSGGRLYKIGITNGTVPEPINIQERGKHQQRPRDFAGRGTVGHQRRQPVQDLCRPHRRRRVQADNARRTIVLPRMVTGWQDAGLLRAAERRVRCLYHPSRRRRGKAADDHPGTP